MALVLGKNKTRKIKVLAEQIGDFDVVVRHNFDIEFKIMPNTDWLDAVHCDMAISDLARESMISIEGVADEQGNPIAYSEELKAALFNETWLVKYINEAWLAVQGGTKQTELYKKEKRKN